MQKQCNEHLNLGPTPQFLSDGLGHLGRRSDGGGGGGNREYFKIVKYNEHLNPRSAPQF